MFSKGSLSLSLPEYISDEDILNHYFGISRIPCLISSPLRVDNNPSFKLFRANNLRVYYKDFSNNDKGNIIDLLKKYFNLTYESVILKLYNESKNIGYKYKIINDKLKSKTREHSITYSDIKVKTRKWKKYDIEYWESYGINLHTLEFGKVYPITTIFVYKYDNTGCLKEYKINADKYAYVFVENKDGIETYKIYQPYSKAFKWRNKHNGSVWSLWTQLPEKGDRLIITSSVKDALCIIANTDIPSVSLQSESTLPKKHIIQQLKDRFEKIYVLYDNDNTGIECGRKLANEYGLIYTEIPQNLSTKDPSDSYKLYGKEKFIEIINKLLIS